MNKRMSSSIFLTNEKKILLVLRDDYEWIYDPGVWAPISGGIKEGEDAKECAIREIYEEIRINIYIEKLHQLGVEERFDSINYFFQAQVCSNKINQIQLQEGQDWGLFEMKQIYKQELYSKKLGINKSIAENILKTNVLDALYLVI